MSERNYWFGHRQFGLGLSPASWQGWLALIVYIVILALSMGQAPALFPKAPIAAALAAAAVETALFMALIWAKRD